MTLENTAESTPDKTVDDADEITVEDIEASAESLAAAQTATAGSEWWRTAVIYQIYPRSFADDDGNGVGDLAGITKRLPSLADLGIDAIWLSPFFRSPQRDAGYDVSDYCDVDPLFGTLADFDLLLETAHGLGLKVIADMVPNHTSSDHAWFQEALAAPEGSPERDRYMFRDGKGKNGQLPPNNWESVFGGSMWERTTNADGTPGQWFLHIFDKSQPDLNWENPWVREQFYDILRFWLDRGVDGFRVDVAHGMIKADGLPDYTPPADGASMGGAQVPSSEVAPLEPVIQDSPPDPPYWGQEGVHEIWRGWHKVLAEYPGDRVLCAEAWVDPLEKVALWVRPDEMSQAFNFAYMFTDWKASALKRVITESIKAFAEVGAPATWVLSNHDVVRHASRLSLPKDAPPQGAGIGPKTPGKPDPVVGLRRARAATSLMLALPGSSYLYQGEELGLPEDMELPDSARQDPTWFRTDGEKYGRDGCRVPIPWESDRPAFGFNETGESWLPQPAEWAQYARDAQVGVPGSTLELYRAALQLRREFGLGAGALTWLKGYDKKVVAFRNGDVTVLANLGKIAVELPVGEVLLASDDVTGGALPRDTTVWLRA
ncbi:alpha-glucosidase [Leifsonia sp. AK011]|uniref:glycoside hydrolase family 13 protein n=1 Tax=Leifsonia sp. AK011 TaxID=2723075 RepID=UPI0015C95842|nr:glycoside hydrolase family 13 protein [Leifsonia sp. AK011]NYF08919.1 alpha-glucosidase [Leifsonia sp. AK011]